MRTVLWISRHEMTPDQRRGLERFMGGEVELLPWRSTVQNIERMAPAIRQADAVAAVLPPDLLGRLLRLVGDRPLLRAVSRRVLTGRFLTLSDGRREPEFAFVHEGWEQVLRLEIETRSV